MSGFQVRAPSRLKMPGTVLTLTCSRWNSSISARIVWPGAVGMASTAWVIP